MVLHYLGEMTMKEISRSLGVSVQTVKVRLYRARERLREEEELLIQEVLGGVQIPSSLKQNIMRKVVDHEAEHLLQKWNRSCRGWLLELLWS